jgi:outer membrane protein assembly factor BamD (BamD/ComL family)
VVLLDLVICITTNFINQKKNNKMEQSKSANQLYQESGSTLSFKDWLEKEKKDQKTFIVKRKG